MQIRLGHTCSPSQPYSMIMILFLHVLTLLIYRCHVGWDVWSYTSEGGWLLLQRRASCGRSGVGSIESCDLLILCGYFCGWWLWWWVWLPFLRCITIAGDLCVCVCVWFVIVQALWWCSEDPAKWLDISTSTLNNEQTGSRYVMYTRKKRFNGSLLWFFISFIWMRKPLHHLKTI